jgi:hypothetical protein
MATNDLLLQNRTHLNWNFSLVILVAGRGGFQEKVEIRRGAYPGLPPEKWSFLK